MFGAGVQLPDPAGAGPVRSPLHLHLPGQLFSGGVSYPYTICQAKFNSFALPGV